MKGEPSDQSEKENKVKSEEKRKEEEYVRRFIQAVKKIHPKVMPKHDLFYPLGSKILNCMICISLISSLLKPIKEAL